MQIFYKNLAGRTVSLSVEANCAVEDVKQLIEAREGIPCAAQRLVCAGKQMAADALIEDGVMYNVVAALDGGAKKRKKKVYKTPKKDKHKKKKVKLAVLKYYKVDSSEKVMRMKRECPNPNCGPGTFMARHPDRYYCGKCALTYLIDQKADA